jgi:endonuclease-8
VPEGDTIWRIASGVRERVGGGTVGAAWPPPFEALTGRTLEAVEPVGKHLLMRFSGGWTLHSHMRMTGSWHLYRPGERWRRPRHLARVVLTFEDWEAVCFAAPVVELVRDARAPLRHLGPDVLGDDFPLDLVVARARSAGPMALGELLLDQRVCSGIGNVYKCETLWQLRLDPWRASDDLTDQELSALFAAARTAMRDNVSRAAPRRFGGQPGAVHGRRGQPCPRCGTPILARPQGRDARITYWCPTCQRSRGGNVATRESD